MGNVFEVPISILSHACTHAIIKTESQVTDPQILTSLVKGERELTSTTGEPKVQFLVQLDLGARQVLLSLSLAPSFSTAFL